MNGDTSSDLNIKSINISEGGTLFNSYGLIVTDYSIPFGKNLSDNNNLVVDALNPTITKLSVSDNFDTTVVFISEPVFNSSLGSGELEVTDFKLNLYGGSAKLVSQTPESIAKSDSSYILGIQITGLPTGGEKLEVVPMANSIFDLVGNAMDTLQINKNGHKIKFTLV